MKEAPKVSCAEMPAEYDFASMKGGVRGKYVRQLKAGSNLVLLEPDVAEAFPTDLAVNQALRAALNVASVVAKSKRSSNALQRTQSRGAPLIANCTVDDLKRRTAYSARHGGHVADKVKGIPEGASVVIPRLVCRDPAAAIDFCVSTFDAVERVRRLGPGGTVAHALVTIGSAMIMIEAEWPTLPSRAPKPDGSSPVVLYVYVDDVDQAVERARASGAEVLDPAKDQFWGDRTANIMDTSGHVWTIASRIEETTEQQRQDRWSSLRTDDRD